MKSLLIVGAGNFPPEVEELARLNGYDDFAFVDDKQSYTLTKEQLQDMKNNGLKTDVMSCIMAVLIMNGKNEAEVTAFLEKADEAGAAPSVSFEAPEDGALNITSPEDNPELDKLIQAIQK